MADLSDAVKSALEQDGTVGPAAAALAVQASFGPDATNGAQATEALHWALTVLDQLPAQDQALVRHVLDELRAPKPTESAPNDSTAPTARGLHLVHRSASRAVTRVDSGGCALYQSGTLTSASASVAVLRYTSIVTTVFGAYEKLLGRAGPSQVEVCSFRPIQRAPSAVATSFDAGGGTAGAAQRCEISIDLPLVEASSDADLTTLLAETASECFLDSTPGLTIDQVLAVRGSWSQDGARWWAIASVLETLGVATHALDDIWDSYLDHPADALSGRHASAMGWFAQINTADPDLGKRLDVVWTSPNSAGAYHAAGGPSVLDTWPSGYFRDPSRGAAWDLTGPFITPTAAQIPNTPIAVDTDLELSSPVFGIDVRTLSISSDLIHVGATGNLRISDGEDDYAAVPDVYFCTRSDHDCSCPPGTEGGPDTQPLGTTADIAFTNGDQTGSASVNGLSLAEVCHRQQTNQPFTMVWIPTQAAGRPQQPPPIGGYTCAGPAGTWRIVLAPAFGAASATTTLTFAASGADTATATWNPMLTGHGVDPETGDVTDTEADYNLTFTVHTGAIPTMEISGTITQTSHVAPTGAAPFDVGPTTVDASTMATGGTTHASMPTLIAGLPDQALADHPDWQTALRTESRTAC